MKIFVSWSGGKDCMFAMYRHLQRNPDASVGSLLHMQRNTSAHGFGADVIIEQAKAMEMPLYVCTVGNDGYEVAFKKALKELKKKGIGIGVFGDIYLEEHKIWVERVCQEMGIHPLFPLWGEETATLIRDFVSEEFKTLVVAMRSDLNPDTFLGRVIDHDFIEDLAKLHDVDLCGEHGEYHTYVFDGPLFKRKAQYVTGTPYEEKRHKILPLHAQIL